MKMTNVSEYMHENQKEIYIKYIFMPLNMAFRIKLVLAVGGISWQRHNDQKSAGWPEGWACSALCCAGRRSRLWDGEISGCHPAPESGGDSRLQKCPQKQASGTKIPEELQKLGVWTTSCSHRRNGLWATTPSCGWQHHHVHDHGWGPHHRLRVPGWPVPGDGEALWGSAPKLPEHWADPATTEGCTQLKPDNYLLAGHAFRRRVRKASFSL